MDDHVRYGKPLLPARLGAMLVGAFGLLGLVLASVGESTEWSRIPSASAHRKSAFALLWALSAPAFWRWC